jgi:hypothetical protein
MDLVRAYWRPRMQIGERVRVLGGPFQGHFGLYAGMKPHARVEVLLAVFGSQQRVTLPRGGIEPAPDSGGKRGIPRSELLTSSAAGPVRRAGCFASSG